MKITKQLAPEGFKPIQFTITCETAEEFEIIQRISNLDVSIPDLIAKENTKLRIPTFEFLKNLHHIVYEGY